MFQPHHAGGRNAIISEDRRWPNAVIPYVISSSYSKYVFMVFLLCVWFLSLNLSQLFFIFLFVCFSLVFLFVGFSASVCFFLSLSLSLSLCLFLCVSLSLCLFLSVSLSLCLFLSFSFLYVFACLIGHTELHIHIYNYLLPVICCKHITICMSEQGNHDHICNATAQH